jgi:hypothetical protein
MFAFSLHHLQVYARSFSTNACLFKTCLCIVLSGCSQLKTVDELRTALFFYDNFSFYCVFTSVISGVLLCDVCLESWPRPVSQKSGVRSTPSR